HHEPDAIERNADRLRRLMIVRDRPQRPPHPRDLEEYRQHSDHRGADQSRDDLRRIDQQAAWKDRFEDENRILRKAKPDLVDVAAPDALTEAVEKVRNAERGHEQD